MSGFLNKKQQVWLAGAVSLFFSPLFWLTGGIIRLLLAANKKGQLAVWEAVVLAIVMLGAPLVFFFFSVAKRRFDFDLTRRSERLIFYVFATGCGFLGLNLAYYFSGEFFRLLLVLMLTGVVFMVVTFWDKASLHVGTLAIVYLTANWLGGWRFIFWLPAVLPVAWARLVLEKHNWRQVAEGLVIPFLIIPAGFSLLGVG